MYERLLDKTLTPTFEDLLKYSGASSDLWLELDSYLQNKYLTQRQIRFPYGNKYGWSMKYGLHNRHVCDAFAENGAFALHFRISDECLNTVYRDLSNYSQKICDEKYPCGEGGWLTYRVFMQEHLDDVKIILSAKITKSILKGKDPLK